MHILCSAAVSWQKKTKKLRNRTSHLQVHPHTWKQLSPEIGTKAWTRVKGWCGKVSIPVVKYNSVNDLLDRSKEKECAVWGWGKRNFVSLWMTGMKRREFPRRILKSSPTRPPEWQQTRGGGGGGGKGRKERKSSNGKTFHSVSGLLIDWWMMFIGVYNDCVFMMSSCTFATISWIMSFTLSSMSSSICVWYCFWNEGRISAKVLILTDHFRGFKKKKKSFSGQVFKLQLTITRLPCWLRLLLHYRQHILFNFYKTNAVKCSKWNGQQLLFTSTQL